MTDRKTKLDPHLLIAFGMFLGVFAFESHYWMFHGSMGHNHFNMSDWVYWGLWGISGLYFLVLMPSAWRAVRSRGSDG